MKQLTSLLLCASVLLTLLASCGDSPAPPSDTTPGTDSAPADTGPVETGPDTSSALPETMDFGGEVISILCRENESNSSYFNEIGVTEEDGDVINDAIYRRNRAVEERLNVDIEPINMDGYWSNKDAFMTRVRNDVIAAENQLDIVVGYAAYISSLVPDGIFRDLSDPPHIDYSKPWWNSDIIENTAAAGKILFTAGDIGISYLNSAYTVYFNKKLADDLSVPDLYETVRQGKWTADTMAEYVRTAARDLNGDNKLDFDNDQYGFVANHAAEYTGTFDIRLIEIDDGRPVLSKNIEKAADVLAWLNRFFYENEGAAPLDTCSVSHEIPLNIFAEGRSLFYSSHLGRMIHMRGMNEDFGVLPHFKWNEEQENYTTIAHDAISLFGVPKGCQNFEATTAVMEALAEEGYRSVLPAYYEKALGSKFTRDEESAEMLDIIRGGLTFRFEMIYASNLGYMQDLFNSLVKQHVDNFASYYAQNQVKWTSMLENLTDAIESLED